MFSVFISRTINKRLYEESPKVKIHLLNIFEHASRVTTFKITFDLHWSLSTWYILKTIIINNKNRTLAKLCTILQHADLREEKKNMLALTSQLEIKHASWFSFRQNYKLTLQCYKSPMKEDLPLTLRGNIYLTSGTVEETQDLWNMQVKGRQWL